MSFYYAPHCLQLRFLSGSLLYVARKVHWWGNSGSYIFSFFFLNYMQFPEHNQEPLDATVFFIGQLVIHTSSWYRRKSLVTILRLMCTWDSFQSTCRPTVYPLNSIVFLLYTLPSPHVPMCWGFVSHFLDTRSNDLSCSQIAICSQSSCKILHTLGSCFGKCKLQSTKLRAKTWSLGLFQHHWYLGITEAFL